MWIAMFGLEIVPSVVRLGTDWLLCCSIMGIHASGYLFPKVDMHVCSYFAHRNTLAEIIIIILIFEEAVI